MKQRTSLLTPRERKYLTNPWFYETSIKEAAKNKKKRLENPEVNIAPVIMPLDSLIDEGNIREVKKLVKKAANEKMAPFMLGHLKEWKLLARGADDIGGIERQRLMDELGSGVEDLAAFIRDWLPSEAKEQLLIELLRYGGEGEALPLDPRSVLRGFMTFFESRRFDSPELETARKKALRHVGALAKGIEDWTPYTRRALELKNGKIVFPDMHLDGAIPYNIYVVKNAPQELRTVRRWLRRQQEFVYHDTEVLRKSPKSKTALRTISTMRLPELILAALSGRGWPQMSRRYLRKGKDVLTEDKMDNWLEGEPNFCSMSVDDLSCAITALVEKENQIRWSKGVYKLERGPKRFNKAIWAARLDEPISIFSHCLDAMKELNIVETTSNGKVQLTKLGKELCRMEPPTWLSRTVFWQGPSDLARNGQGERSTQTEMGH